MDEQASAGPSRRNIMTGLMAAGVGVPLLAACAEKVTPEPKVAKGQGLVKAADVPVGGGVVLASANVVVTQPVANEFKCFTAVCTHQHCQVGTVTDGAIVCPCHGSHFSIKDGSNTGGPNGSPAGSTAPLQEFTVHNVKGEIQLG